jgi:hypothetical protein
MTNGLTGFGRALDSPFCRYLTQRAAPIGTARTRTEPGERAPLGGRPSSFRVGPSELLPGAARFAFLLLPIWLGALLELCGLLSLLEGRAARVAGGGAHARLSELRVRLVHGDH